MTETSKDNGQQFTGNWVTETYKRAETERKEREEANKQQSKEFFDKMRDKANAEADEIKRLTKQVAEMNYNESKLKREKEIESAKQKAMQQIESEYERKYGINSDKTNGIDQAWSNLLKDL
ncbi:phage protein [Lactococcus piscium]|uniref:Phage protein n=1 Tax=Pseudolactococcus piscium TaxID=1364 RepID=A0A2A5S543_9LACT|nr:hypothetical protein [Lactococcus piscium]PCS08584.1 phage protein [Lactococcus piscium]